MSRPAPAPPATEARPDEAVVLVVDDDEAMRGTVLEMLASQDIAGAGAGSAEAARQLQAELGPAVALVDHRLPDAAGVELGAALKERDPDLTVLLVTGYASLENAIAAVGHVDGYLTKPVPPPELLRVVRAGLESARLRRENRALVDELRDAKARLEESVAERTGELAGLVTMAEAVAGRSGLAEVVQACLATAFDVSEADYAGLYLRDDASGSLVLAAARGPAALPERLEPSSRAFALDGSGGDEDVVPLVAGGDEVGALLLGATGRRRPMFLATLAAAAAVAIQNAQRLGRERETVERLSELSRMKSTFLATVSHELRTPLAAVSGLAEMLGRRLESAPPAQQLELVEQILEQARRLSGLIDDLFDATRVEFGGLRVRLGEIDVGSVIERVRRSFAGRGCSVTVSAPPSLPPAQADERRLEQVLANLVGNAVKHSPPDAPVELHVAAGGGELRLAVVDAGPGIAPEFLPLVFEPFAQGAEGDRNGQEGLGLGLYIARGLVEAMGGSIEAHSSPGAGSRFEVRLRRAEAA